MSVIVHSPRCVDAISNYSNSHYMHNYLRIDGSYVRLYTGCSSAWIMSCSTLGIGSLLSQKIFFIWIEQLDKQAMGMLVVFGLGWLGCLDQCTRVDAITLSFNRSAYRIIFHGALSQSPISHIPFQINSMQICLLPCAYIILWMTHTRIYLYIYIFRHIGIIHYTTIETV